LLFEGEVSSSNAAANSEDAALCRESLVGAAVKLPPVPANASGKALGALLGCEPNGAEKGDGSAREEAGHAGGAWKEWATCSDCTPPCSDCTLPCRGAEAEAKAELPPEKEEGPKSGAEGPLKAGAGPLNGAGGDVKPNPKGDGEGAGAGGALGVPSEGFEMGRAAEAKGRGDAFKAKP
jgi:hypothetical protein